MAEFALEPRGPEVQLAPGESAREISGRSPWRIAGRRLVRNRLAMAALGLFVLIVVLCLLAPFYANHIAKTDPFESNLTGTTNVNGEEVQVVQETQGGLGLGVTPIGPTWQGNYFIGADNQGRDVMARVLYGGRASLQIGVASAVICTLIALTIALLAGFFRGWTDSVLSRVMDLIWAFPVYLLAISLATVLLTKPEGLKWGPVTINPSSFWVPTWIIAIVYVPYVYRPLRGQVLSVREKEYVEAAKAAGATDLRIMLRHMLPNTIGPIVVSATLTIGTAILLEAVLSFLGFGIEPPTPALGALLNEGQDQGIDKWWLVTFPGIVIVIIVLCINFVGDGLRDALDPTQRRVRA